MARTTRTRRTMRTMRTERTVRTRPRVWPARAVGGLYSYRALQLHYNFGSIRGNTGNARCPGSRPPDAAPN
eukprot:11191730-Lingulodinium_polyedra.AAC.1